MKEYSTANLSLDDLLRDLNRNTLQVKYILKELESRGNLSNGISLVWGYLSEFFHSDTRERIRPNDKKNWKSYLLS